MLNEERKNIFTNFWSKMTWGDKNTYVQGLAKLEKGKILEQVENSRRDFLVKYYLRVNNQEMLLGTRIKDNLENKIEQGE